MDISNPKIKRLYMQERVPLSEPAEAQHQPAATAEIIRRLELLKNILPEKYTLENLEKLFIYSNEFRVLAAGLPLQLRPPKTLLQEKVRVQRLKIESTFLPHDSHRLTIHYFRQAVKQLQEDISELLDALHEYAK